MSKIRRTERKKICEDLDLIYPLQELKHGEAPNKKEILQGTRLLDWPGSRLRIRGEVQM